MLTGNVALNKPTKASMEWEEFVSGNVVDGNATQTPWIAGSDPPQWVEVDLQERYDLEAIQIVVETGSDDPFFYTHEIQVKRSSSATYQTIHTFADDRVNFETLTYRPPDGSLIKDVRFVRVRIPQAPGWAALHELRALIPEARTKFDVPPPPILTFPRPSLDQWEGSLLTWKNDSASLPATIQIAGDSLFSQVIKEVTDVTKEQLNISDLDGNEILCWRVKQQNSFGESVWSVVGKLDQMRSAIQEEGQSFRIYPNPARDYLMIDDQGQGNLPRHFSIWSLGGQMMTQFEPNSAGDRIEIKGLSPGLYILRVLTKSGIANFKFIRRE